MSETERPARLRTRNIEGQPVRCIETDGDAECGCATARLFKSAPSGVRRASALTPLLQSCGVFRTDRSRFDEIRPRARSGAVGVAILFSRLCRRGFKLRAVPCGIAGAERGVVRLTGHPTQRTI